MDLKEIKRIIQEEKAKIVIADEAGPTIVIMSYEDYRKMKGGVKATSGNSANTAVSKEADSESLRIDDLPF